ncbi:hypothetical protein D3C80_1349190 [compost metagenome]
MPVLVVQDKDVGEALAEHPPGEGPRSVLDAEGVRPRRHAQHDRHGDGPSAPEGLGRKFRGPVARERPHLGATGQALAVRPLQGQPSVAGDVVEVPGEMACAVRLAGDLDHGLRRPPGHARQRRARALAAARSRGP